VPEKTIALPLTLSIPAIGVQANIQHVGLTSEGAMDVPTTLTDVGWFRHGPPPGARGSAVISGHFNGPKNEKGVFFNLHTLTIGDLLSITDTTGNVRTFAVKHVQDYDPGRVDEVFTKNDFSHLNLITCQGVWEPKTKSYSKRRIVFTDLVE